MSAGAAVKGRADQLFKAGVEASVADARSQSAQVTPNPWLERLGCRATDRVVVLHADDLGMTHETFGAVEDWLDAGLTFSASVMAPCPWFREAIAFARRHPKLDLGVHATLNAEWEGYRWRPVSTVDPRSGLMDRHGYMHTKSRVAMRTIGAMAGIRELVAQFRMVRDAGIRPSHLDVHMGTPFHPKFMPGYLGLALRNRLPAFVPRLSPANLERVSGGSLTKTAFTRIFRWLETRMPLFDGMIGMPLDNQPRGVAEATRILGALGPGLWHVFIHPARDSVALRSFCRSWRSRVADWKTFSTPAFRQWARGSGIRFLRYADLRRAMSRNGKRTFVI